MKIKIGCTRIDAIIKVIDKAKIDDITFAFTGIKRGINAEFECNTEDFATAKACAKKIIKSNDEFSALFISIQK